MRPSSFWFIIPDLESADAIKFIAEVTVTLGPTVTRTVMVDMAAPLMAMEGEDHTAEDSVVETKCPT